MSRQNQNRRPPERPPALETAKLPYRDPQLIDYGSLTELTGTSSGTLGDGGFFQFTGGKGFAPPAPGQPGSPIPPGSGTPGGG